MSDIEKRMRRAERESIFTYFTGNYLTLGVLIGLAFLSFYLVPPLPIIGFTFLFCAVVYFGFHTLMGMPPLEPAEPSAPKPLTRPATPEELKDAERSLKVARAFIDDYWKLNKEHGKEEHFNADMQMVPLKNASRAIQKAAAIDPNVKLTVADKDGELTYTQDMIAAEILHLEATAYEYDGLNAVRGYTPNSWDRKQQYKDRDKAFLCACYAAERAAKLQPTSSYYHTHLAKMYRHVGEKQKAKMALQKALELNPDNVDALKLMSEF
jgi:tetratricopeptide (TPR) repeat protein